MNQSPGQWAVRWFVLVATTVLVVSVPVFHLTRHVVLGHTEPLLRNRSHVAAPALTQRGFLDGSWMLAGERHLRECSPVVWWLRATWNELLWRLGVPQSSVVHFGADGWLFMEAEREPDLAEFRRRATVRRAFLRDLLARVRAAGAELVVAVVPDKSRIYADRAWPDGRIGARKEPVYGELQQEFAALGVPSVDLAGALATARTLAPTENLFYRCDTHWRAPGAFAAARAIAAVVEQSTAAAGLAPRRSLTLSSRHSVQAFGDLVAMAGFATADIPNAGGGFDTTAFSLVALSFRESRDYYFVGELSPSGEPTQFTGKELDAEVWLVGTSFAGENGVHALSLALGRPVRGLTESGATGLGPMRKAMADLADPQAPVRPKVLVWEIVERGFSEPEWRAPRL